MSPVVLLIALPLLVALVVGCLGRRPGRRLRGALFSGMLLALSLPLLLGVSRPGSMSEASAGNGEPAWTEAAQVLTPFAPQRLVELVLPDLWEGLPHQAPSLITQTYSPTLATQQAQAGSASTTGTGGRLHLGITALCLAIMGFVGLGGWAAWLGRLAVVLGLLLACGDALGAPPPPADVVLVGVLCLSAGLAVLAGLALASLLPLEDDDPVGAALLLGAVCLVLAGGLVGWAATAGSGEARDVLAPLLLRIEAAGNPTPTAVIQAQAATHLTRVLDQAAIAAVAAMTALLLHLKGRRLPTAILVFVVSAAELWAVHTGFSLF